MIQEGPLDELASTFVIPSKSGVYLAKSELIALARVIEGSLRISDRKRMLADVLKSPDSPEGLDRLMGLLIDFCAAHVARYAELSAEFPALAPILAEPTARARATIARLEAVRDELRIA